MRSCQSDCQFILIIKLPKCVFISQWIYLIQITNLTRQTLPVCGPEGFFFRIRISTFHIVRHIDELFGTRFFWYRNFTCEIKVNKMYYNSDPVPGLTA
jgi:hypothetical protein